MAWEQVPDSHTPIVALYHRQRCGAASKVGQSFAQLAAMTAITRALDSMEYTGAKVRQPQAYSATAREIVVTIRGIAAIV